MSGVSLGKNLLGRCLPVLLVSVASAQDRIHHVDRGVQFLLRTQDEAGSWGNDVYQGEARPAVTALVVMALDAHLPALKGETRRKATASLAKGMGFLGSHEPSSGRVRQARYRMRNWNNGFVLLAALRLRKTQELDALDALVESHVRALVDSQEPEGGWTYSPNWARGMENSTAIQTSICAAALVEARAQGFEVKSATFARAWALFDVLRREDKTYAYAKNHWIKDGPAGTCARNVAVELARWSGGKGTAAQARWAVENFLRHRRTLESVRSAETPKGRRRSAYHWGPDSIARYYFFTGYLMTHQALLGLGPEAPLSLESGASAKPVTSSAALTDLRREIRAIQEQAGSWVDSPHCGKAYATAMALLVLSDAKLVSLRP